MKAKNSLAEILREVLADDPSLIGRREAFLHAMEARRDDVNVLQLHSLLRAVREANIGAYFSAADGDVDSRQEAYAEAKQALQSISMQERSIERVLDAIVQALGWNLRECTFPKPSQERSKEILFTRPRCIHPSREGVDESLLSRPLETFFTERMVVIEPEHACPHAFDIKGMDTLATEDLTPVLPIRRELLALFPPQEIAQRLSFENRDDGIVVKFRFPVTGANGVTEYLFSKKYTNTAGLILVDSRVPVTEIWPNFRRQGWSKYYLFYENTEAENGQELGKDVLYVAPWTSGREIAKTLPQGGLTNCYTVSLDGFPEALFCSVIPSQDGPGATPIDIGAFLLKEPPMVQREPELTWDLGIDFGTSSTMLYCRADQGAPEPLSFGSHLYQVLDSLDQRLRTFVNFIPCAPVEGRQANGSLQSCFHVLTVGALARNVIRPLEDGNIFALHLTENYKEILGKHALRIDTNLKWQDDAIGRRKVAAYLTQVCMQACAEAAAYGVTDVQWHLSVSPMFSAEQAVSFRAMCRSVVKEAVSGTPFAKQSKPAPVFLSSSIEAMARYFLSVAQMNGDLDSSILCINFMEERTDIAFIGKQRWSIVYHMSLPLCGDDFWHPIFAAYDVFCEASLVQFPLLWTEAIKSDLREYGEERLETLKTLINKPDVRQALQGAQLAVAGLFYYLGLILRVLVARGVYCETSLPAIYVGGRASAIFSWLAGGCFEPDSPFLRIFGQMMAEASGLSTHQRLTFHLSDRPGIEIAAGMIELFSQGKAFFDIGTENAAIFDSEPYSVEDAFVAGDTYFIKNVERHSETFLTAHDISAGIHTKKLTELRKFLAAFDASQNLWSDGLHLSEEAIDEIERRVSAAYVEETGKRVRNIDRAPVFLRSLNVLLDVLSQKNS